jgi:hypothetical protein
MFGRQPETPQMAQARELERRSRMIKEGKALDGADEQKSLPAGRIVFLSWLALTAALAGGALLAPAHDAPLRAVPAIGEALSSAKPPALTGNAMADAALAAGLQSAAICLAAALLPLCARVWRKMRDNAQGNLYILFWGTTVCVPFVYLFVKDFFGPLLLDIFSMFTM